MKLSVNAWTGVGEIHVSVVGMDEWAADDGYRMLYQGSVPNRNIDGMLDLLAWVGEELLNVAHR